MKTAERRKAIVNRLLSSSEPVSGSVLSAEFEVSRQIIVQDITVLKSGGYDILSTHKGYIVRETPLKERVFKLRHTTEQTEDELNLIVENGGTVVDVPATYLYSLKDNVASYAVRVTNIPRAHEKTLIYARPYYVYLFNGEEIVVYGDVCSKSYTPADSNDVTMDW